MQRDKLGTVLAWVARRAAVDRTVRDGQPADRAVVASILREDPTLSPAARLAYVRHLLALALALRETGARRVYCLGDSFHDRDGASRLEPHAAGMLAAMLFLEAAKRCLEGNKPLTGVNLKAALNSIRDFDTGGLIGVPISIPGNSIPVGRVYKADMKAQKMVAASDWIKL